MPNQTSYIKIFLLLLLYVILLGCTRILLTDGIEIDEAEQSYLSQWFLWGYDIQPPLYTWITIALIEVFGNHHWVYVAFRMVLFFLSYTGLFLLFSRISQNPNLGWAAVVFALFLPQFSTESLRHTHTVLVTVASIWTLVCIERLWKNPNLKYYLWLGIALSVGILSKYNFLIFMSSIGATLLLFPKGRTLFFSWKSAATFLLVFLLITPHFVWVWQHIWELSSGIKTDLGSSAVETESFGWASKVTGLGVLFINLLSFLSAFLLVFAVSHFNYFKSIYLAETEWTKFFEYFFAVVLLQFVLMVIFFNATIFHERWMQPIFVFFPGYCLLKLYPVVLFPKQRMRIRRLGYLAAATILIIIVARIAILPTFFQKTIRLNLPHEQFCQDLQTTVKENDVELIITDDVMLGGYLNQTFAEIPVLVQEPKYKLVNSIEYKKSENKNALLVWTWSWRDAGDSSPPMEEMPASLQSLTAFPSIKSNFSEVQTYDYQYGSSKKASYRHGIFSIITYQ